MSSADPLIAMAALDSAYDALLDADFATLDAATLVQLQTRFERNQRRAPAAFHALLTTLQSVATPRELGATGWTDVLTTSLRLSRREARERLSRAEHLGPRQALSGEPLDPVHDATAAAQRRGDISAEHVEIIARFHKELPSWVDVGTRAHADTDLANRAATLTPEGVREYARALMAVIDQDGPEPDDTERARKRGITIGAQRRDGMSRISGELTSQARATLEAVFAKLAAPGMNNPDNENPCHETPTADGEPSDEQKNTDYRTTAQRQHDALEAMGLIVLSAGELGKHKSLPATIIVTTTLQDLERGAGIARTAGGTRLPMRDVIRLAARSYHYLAVFDEHTNRALHLGRARRCASTAQKIMLLARDRGCTRPNCAAPGYHTEVHHLTPWKDGGQTNVDEMTLACPPDNRLEDQTPWTTAMNPRGRPAWKPPPFLDTGQARVNDYHHPERMLRGEGTEDDDAAVGAAGDTTADAGRDKAVGAAGDTAADAGHDDAGAKCDTDARAGDASAAGDTTAGTASDHGNANGVEIPDSADPATRRPDNGESHRATG